MAAGKEGTVLYQAIHKFLVKLDGHGFNLVDFRASFLEIINIMLAISYYNCNKGISSRYDKNHRITKTLACYRQNYKHVEGVKNEAEIFNQFLNKFDDGYTEPKVVDEYLYEGMQDYLGDRVSPDGDCYGEKEENGHGNHDDKSGEDHSSTVAPGGKDLDACL